MGGDSEAITVRLEGLKNHFDTTTLDFFPYQCGVYLYINDEDTFLHSLELINFEKPFYHCGSLVRNFLDFQIEDHQTPEEFPDHDNDYWIMRYKAFQLSEFPEGKVVLKCQVKTCHSRALADPTYTSDCELM